MNRLFLAALVSVVLPGPSWAQEAFTPEALEKILTQDLKRDFLKKTIKTTIVYDIKDTPYYIDINSSGKFMFFYTKQKLAGADLKKVNEWNQGAIFSRAYLVGDYTIFEVPLSFAAGVTKPVVLHYYNKFEEEFGKFKIFIEKK